MRDRLLAGLPYGSVRFGAIQLCRLVILRQKTHAVAIGKLDDQAGKLEERVGFGTRADLLGDSLDGTGFGKELQFPSFKKGLGCGLRAPVALLARSPAVSTIDTIPSSLIAGTGGAAILPGASTAVVSSSTLTAASL